MPKQLNGMPGKKPAAPSVKRRPVKSFSTMLEIPKAGGLDRPMRRKVVGVLNWFRHGAAGDRCPTMRRLDIVGRRVDDAVDLRTAASNLALLGRPEQACD